jgi:hypothetical protein
MAARLLSRCTEHLSPQLSYAYRLCVSAFGSTQRRQQTPCVPWRAQQVGCFDEPSEFGSRNQGNIARASAPYDNGLLLVHDLIQNAR